MTLYDFLSGLRTELTGIHFYDNLNDMTETDNQKLYELTYFLSPELNESDILTCTGKIKKIIGEAGGNITAEVPIQKKQIGQPIKKFTFGYFGIFYFQIEPTGIEELKNNLKLEPKILRYMIIAKKPVSAAKEKPALKTAKKPKSAGAPAPTEKPAAAPTAKIEKMESEKEKAQMEELDKKLEEILKE